MPVRKTPAAPGGKPPTKPTIAPTGKAGASGVRKAVPPPKAKAEEVAPNKLGKTPKGGSATPAEPKVSRKTSGSQGIPPRKTTGSLPAVPSEEESSQGGKRPARERHERPVTGAFNVTVKFVISITLLILFVTGLFGYTIINLFASKFDQEIIRSAYGQVLVWRWQGDNIFEHFLNSGDAGKEPDTETYMRKEQGQQDVKELRRAVEGDPRILDVAIFKAKVEGEENPSQIILVAKQAKNFTRPTANDRRDVELDGNKADSDIDIWEGYYTTEKGKEKAVFVRAPVRKSANNKTVASVTLVLSKQAIEAEIGRLWTKVVIFLLFFVLLGFAISVGMAKIVTTPIKTLIRDIKTVAAGDLQHETRPHFNDEIGELAVEFNKMTRQLRDSNQREREVERLNSELNMAKDIHAKLLPEKVPSIDGYDIFTGYYCAKEVGGDYFDFIPVDLEKGLMGMVVADVSGKGIPGSMVMGTTRTILRLMATFIEKRESPSAVLSHTNHHVARDIKRGMFVTMVYAILDVRNATMTIASAGHNPTCVWRAATRKVELVRPNGIALGFDKGPIFERTIREQKIQLDVGDRVVFYTDGVVESMNEKREEYGDDKFYEWVAQHAELPSNEFVRLLSQELDRHKGRAEQHDDITVTTLRLEV
jgi:serine phosphatase RsbU (regulator of sigma subunit)